jgi:cytochrome c-type biogenesis protein CcmH
MEDNPRAGSHPPDPSQARPPARRRGIRTVVLSAVALVGLAALAVSVLWNSLGTPEGTASGGGSATQSARTGSGLSPSAAEGPAIAGTISVAPERRGRVSDSDTLFIIARKGAGGIGPPFAVKRITGPHFPLEYRLGPGDVMMAGTAFEGDVHLSVRLSKSGAAGPGEPGDLEGEYPG